MSLILSIENDKCVFASALYKQRILNPDDPNEEYFLKEFQMFLDMLIAHNVSIEQLKELRQNAKLIKN